MFFSYRNYKFVSAETDGNTMETFCTSRASLNIFSSYLSDKIEFQYIFQKIIFVGVYLIIYETHKSNRPAEKH